MNELLNNEKLLNVFKEDIQIKNTPLEKLEKLDSLKPRSEEYKVVYSNVISVGEYEMERRNNLFMNKLTVNTTTCLLHLYFITMRNYKQSSIG